MKMNMMVPNFSYTKSYYFLTIINIIIIVYVIVVVVDFITVVVPNPKIFLQKI